MLRRGTSIGGRRQTGVVYASLPGRLQALLRSGAADLASGPRLRISGVGPARSGQAAELKHFGSCVMLCAAISNADDDPLAPFTGHQGNSSSAGGRATATPFGMAASLLYRARTRLRHCAAASGDHCSTTCQRC